MPRFIPRERKHKRRARQSEDFKHESTDTNATEIVPAPPNEREVRRKALQQQLRAEQGESQISSKKRKRLEKYVDTKLRKEENAELVRKLANQSVDTTLLRSSKKLGRTRETQRERLQRALNERDVLGIDHRTESVLLEPRRQLVEAEHEIDDASRSDSDDGGDRVVPSAHQGDVAMSVKFGSGLKRPLELDEAGQPIMRKRKRQKQQTWASTTDDQEQHEAFEYHNGSLSNGYDQEEEWEGFSEPEQESPADNGDSSGSSSSVHVTDNDEQSQSSSEEQSTPDEKPTRISAFKAWADSQRNAAIGFVPSAEQRDSGEVENAKVKANFTPRAPSPDPLLESVSTTTAGRSTPSAAAITVPRSEEIQTARLELPVVQEEQRIMETINANPVTIICGATGSGKTTQIPQMLFENGYASLVGTSSSTRNLQAKGMIGITQPRRVAATSVADRVAHEIGPEHKNRVAHQVRYDTNVSKSTAIKFMTDGILLREIQSDFPLSMYSCIIIDEAHERSVNTDILIGMLSRIVRLRAELANEQPEKFGPLKLVIMSATMRIDDFLQNERLFGAVKPPIVEIEGRQYAVTEHFARRTKRDYVSEMVEKVARGHRKLPGGGMLAFLTGQQEIGTVSRRIKERLGALRGGWDVGGSNRYKIDDFEDGAMAVQRTDEVLEDDEDNEDVDSDAQIDVDDELDNEFDVPDEDISISKTKGVLKPYILPLYAALPASQQQKVFQPPPEGHRLIVLATNVAETSLTIPGVRYVFDCGRSKEKRYDPKTGIQTFEVDWISKASAAQRKGRAGRTGPSGHVWRLYSSAVYEQYFDEHTIPEILRTPLESVVLQLKGWEIENVANFPFPTAPEAEQLAIAEMLLKNLGAIRGGSITDIGKEIMRFPVSPRFGRMLGLAKRNGVVQHAVALVAGLAVGELYITEAQSSHLDGAESEEGQDEGCERQHQAYTRAQATLSRWDDHSDAMKLLTAVAAHAEAQKKGLEESRRYCKDFWLREKGMTEVQQLRMQLQSILSAQDSASSSEVNDLLPLSTDKERGILNQIIAAGFIDQVAVRADMLKDEGVLFAKKSNRAIEMAYRTLIPTVSDADIDPSASPEERLIQKSVFVHPSSVLAKLSPKEMPQYIVYSHLSQARTTLVGGRTKRTRMHPLTAVEPKALAALAEGSPLLQIGKPLGKIDELPNRRRQCWVGVSMRPADVGGAEWSLGAWKVVQKREMRGDWTIEKVIAR